MATSQTRLSIAWCKRAAIVLGGLAASCVDRGPGPEGKKIDPAYVQAHLLAAPPAAGSDGFERFDLAVGDVAVYLGNRVDRTKVAPGSPVTVTHYWKVVKPPGPGWRVFTIVRGEPGTADFINPDPSDMQRAHGPQTWEAGEIIEDSHPLTIRPDWRSKTATISVGLIELGKHGPLDRMEVTGSTERVRDRAIVARTVDIDLSRAPPPKGTIHIPRANGPIMIDGVGGDPGWLGAVQSDLVTAEGSADPPGKATVKLTWDDQFLYLFATITDPDIVSPFKQQDDPLWKGDCVEIFIDADGNRSGYVELQVNPAGVTFDSWFATTRARPGDEAWDSNMVAATKLRGSTAEADSGDQGWDVELGIPWAAVKGKNDAMGVVLPPQVGNRWRLNVVRVDRKSGKPNDVTAASWNRITLSDFHALDRMLTAVFADGTGAIAPASPPPSEPVRSPAHDVAFTRVRLASAAPPNAHVIELADPTAQQKLDGRQLTEAELVRELGELDGAKPIALRVAQTVLHTRVTQLVERLEDRGITELVLLTGADLKKTVAPATAQLPASLAIDQGRLEVIAGAVNARLGGLADPLNDSDTDALLAAIAARHNALEVVVRGEPSVRFARVLGALERATRAGFQTLAIAPPVVALPPGGEAALAALAATTPLELSVTNADTQVANLRLDDDQLLLAVQTALAKDPKRSVVLKVDPNAAHRRVLAVIEVVRRAGGTAIALAASGSPIALVTEAAAPPRPPAPPPSPPAVAIEIPLAGQTLIDGTPIGETELAKRLGELAVKDKTTAIVIKADRGVSHGRVLAIAQAATQAGLTRLAIAGR